MHLFRAIGIVFTMIGIVAALKCEAEALIQRFSLKPYSTKTFFPIFGNEKMALVISGVGKLRAAAATGYLRALFACKGWLNVGIAGHKDLSVGEAVYAHQVRDQSSNHVYYPVFGWKLQQKTASVLTVDEIELHYESEAVYDMEAVGFCSAAFHFSTSEWIHCIKVIADNQQTSPKRDAKWVCGLIEHQMPSIEWVIDTFQNQMDMLAIPFENLTPFTQKWHFSFTEEQQLRRLLQRWEACHPGKNIWSTPLTSCVSGKEVIRYLVRCFN